VRTFTANISRRIENLDVSKKHYLLPLYEAVINSINAIEERRQKSQRSFMGSVVVEIIRDDMPVLYDEKENHNFSQLNQPIVGFKIKDNGIGFDEENLLSFMESDSPHKANYGGKGIGRFTWLKFFESATIDSIYLDGDSWVERKFKFSLPDTTINDELVDCDITEYKTEITLKQYLAKYNDIVPKNSLQIINSITQHCLQYILMKPDINLCVVDCGEKYALNDMIQNKILDKLVEDIVIEKYNFSLTNMKICQKDIGGNFLYLCANKRVVEKIDLDKKIPDLNKNDFEKLGFYYVGVLSGDYLDDNVNMNRLNFNFPEYHENEDSMFYELDKEHLVNDVVDNITCYLCGDLKKIEERKIDRISQYIHEKAPLYNHLTKFMLDDIKKIPVNASDDKLDDELNKISRKFDKITQKENAALLEAMGANKLDNNSIKKMLDEQLPKISESNKSALAEYVFRRKIILELFRQGLLCCADEKRRKEAYLHSIIYPMRKTSNDSVGYDEQNLWLIDERLAYCKYISSDVSLNHQEDKDRPDIYFLDEKTSLSDEINTGKEYESIVIFEFKRPQRNDYTDVDNPIVQLLKYINKFKSQKVEDSQGRPVRTGDHTQFYLYVIADITPSLQTVLERDEVVYTADKLGCYKFFKNYNAYLEILSYDKIVNDAVKRNRILFDKLGVNCRD